MSGRPKGFAPWKPRKKTLELLAEVHEVRGEYRAYLPLTVQQVYYRLTARGHPKTRKFYGQVQELCARARRSGLIDFADIRDDGVSRHGGEFYCYTSPEHYYRLNSELYNHYERSWHADQPSFVVVLCEAEGMLPLVGRAIEDYRGAAASSSGFDSVTAKHDLYRDAVERHELYGQRTTLLHLGDHDPSGVSVHESMAEDLTAFCEDTEGVPDDLIELRRIALTPEQITDLRIETKPDEVKPTDSRSRRFIERGLEPAAQLEAIEPDVLIEICRHAVEDALDMDTLHESRQRERREYREVQEKLDEVNAILREAFGTAGGRP